MEHCQSAIFTDLIFTFITSEATYKFWKLHFLFFHHKPSICISSGPYMKNFDATSKKFSWPYPCGHRLLHSPSLVAVGLSVWYETWPPIDWHHPFVIGWSKGRLELPSAPLHYGLTWPVGIPTVFQTPVTVPLHCNCLLWEAVTQLTYRLHAEVFPEVSTHTA